MIMFCKFLLIILKGSYMYLISNKIIFFVKKKISQKQNIYLIYYKKITRINYS